MSLGQYNQSNLKWNDAFMSTSQTLDDSLKGYSAAFIFASTPANLLIFFSPGMLGLLLWSMQILGINATIISFTEYYIDLEKVKLKGRE